jgi:F-type H+-transporting ATPase subunit gamma
VAGQERVLRRRIRSVEATKKITRAMELIAASQMMRAQARIAGSKPYLAGIEQILTDAAADGSAPERLIGVPQSPGNVAVVAIVSDRGLCGGYNLFVLRAADRLMRTGEGAGRRYRLVTAGRRAISYLRFRRRVIDESFLMGDRPSYEEARRVARTVVPPFMRGELDLVQLVSTRFVSIGTQVVETRQLLPLLPPGAPPERRGPEADPSGRGRPGEEEAFLRPGDVGHQTPATPPPLSPPPGQEAPTVVGQGATKSPAEAGTRASLAAGQGYFEYEPEPEDLLSLLVPRYAEAALYGAMLEASASEHIARQRAMSAATENADELIKTLRRVMNRARQDAITTEIMEIVGGAEALRAGAGREERPGQDSIATEEAVG